MTQPGDGSDLGSSAPGSRAPGSSAAAVDGPRSVLLAGGGTAGHVEPALAVADALRARRPQTRITLLGTATGLEARLVPARGYPLELLPRVPLPRRLTAELLTVPGRLLRAVAAAGEVIARTDADIVVGFGGYVALPAYLAARRRRVPLVVHEANPLPGLANRVGARLTRYVATSSRETRLPHGRLVGIPLRPQILALDRAAERAGARESFGLPATGPVLLVFGGSQGARHLNEVVVAAARQLSAAGVAVLHAAGPAHADALAAAVPAGLPTPYRVVPYLERMDLAYAAADLALCRSGALTCAELAAVGLPAVFVPLPVGNGEQRLNARPTVEAGGGLLVEDADLSPQWLVDTVLPVLTDPAQLAALAGGARRVGHRDAAERMVALVLEAAASAAQRAAA